MASFLRFVARAIAEADDAIEDCCEHASSSMKFVAHAVRSVLLLALVLAGVGDVADDRLCA